MPGQTERFLRSSGQEVSRVPTSTEDGKVFTMASHEQAVLITRDRDFLNFLPASPSGIIFIQIHPPIAGHITQAMSDLLESANPSELLGRVVILRRDGYEIFQ